MAGLVISSQITRADNVLQHGYRLVWSHGRTDDDFFRVTLEAIGAIKATFPTGLIGFALQRTDSVRGDDVFARAISGSFGAAVWTVSHQLPTVVCEQVRSPLEQQLVFLTRDPVLVSTAVGNLQACGIAMQPVGHSHLNKGGFAYHLFFFRGSRTQAP